MTEATCEAEGIAAVNRDHAEGPSHAAGYVWRWTMRLVGQVRRQVLSRLRPGYVARMRAQRRGACRGCGSCCDLTFHCPFLTAECRCSHYEKRTLTCRDFPIDAVDLELTRVPCGFHFGPDTEDETGADSAG